jgi:hypothetical protein
VNAVAAAVAFASDAPAIDRDRSTASTMLFAWARLSVCRPATRAPSSRSVGAARFGLDVTIVARTVG